MKVPKAIQNLIEAFERLPGIGPKTAQRLTFYLLHVPQSELDRFAGEIKTLKNETFLCPICFNIGEANLPHQSGAGQACEICEDSQRDRTTICVVEEPLDVLALEKVGRYNGLYHVLHGRIDPLNNIGPDEIYIKQLLDRVSDNQRRGSASICEVILATNPTMEGEATAMYILKQIQQTTNNKQKIKVTRIGRGLPVGADIEYADEITLQRAMEGRSEYS